MNKLMRLQIESKRVSALRQEIKFKELLVLISTQIDKGAKSLDNNFASMLNFDASGDATKYIFFIASLSLSCLVRLQSLGSALLRPDLIGYLECKNDFVIIDKSFFRSSSRLEAVRCLLKCQFCCEKIFPLMETRIKK